MVFEADLRQAIQEFKFATLYFVVILILTISGVRMFPQFSELGFLEILLIVVGTPFFAPIYTFGLIFLIMPTTFLRNYSRRSLFKFLLRKFFIDGAAVMVAFIPIIILSPFLIIGSAFFIFFLHFFITKNVASMFFIMLYAIGYGYQVARLIGIFIISRILSYFEKNNWMKPTIFRSTEGNILSIMQVQERHRIKYIIFLDGIQVNSVVEFISPIFEEFRGKELHLRIIKSETRPVDEGLYARVLIYFLGEHLFAPYTYIELELANKYLIILKSDPFEYGIVSSTIKEQSKSI